MSNKTNREQQHNNKKQPSMLGAAAIQFGSRYANVAMQIVLTAVLARLLTPQEFGTVAIVSVFTSFFAVFADLGIGPAIVQFPDLEESDINALFSFSALVAIVASIAFFFLSWPIAAIYGDPQLIPLFHLTSAAVFFSTINMVPNGLLLQNKQFGTIGGGVIVATLVSGIVGVGAAVFGLGCYALVAQSIVLSAATFFWNLAHTKVGFGFTGMRSSLKRIANFSGFQTAFQFVNYFSRNLDNLLTGAFMGPETLGQYDKAYKLMQMPSTYLSGIFSSVLQPYLAAYSNELDRVYDFWIRMSKFLAILGIWASLIIFFCAEDIVLILYGPQWIPSIPALQMLSLSIALQMVNSTGGAILQSIEHTDYLFASGLIDACISVACILVGVMVFKRIDALGACVSVAYLGHACVNLFFIGKKGLRHSAARTIWKFARIAAATCLTALAFYLLCAVLPSLSPFVNLAIRGGILTGLLLAALLLMGEKQSLGFIQYTRTIGTETDEQ